MRSVRIPLYTYLFYQRCVRSCTAFPGHIPCARVSAQPTVDLELRRVDTIQTLPFLPDSSSEVYANRLGAHPQTGDIELHRRSTWYCLRFREIVDVFFEEPQQAIWYAASAVSLELLGALLTSPLMALL